MGPGWPSLVDNVDCHNNLNANASFDYNNLYYNHASLVTQEHPQPLWIFDDNPNNDNVDYTACPLDDYYPTDDSSDDDSLWDYDNPEEQADSLMLTTLMIFQLPVTHRSS